MNLILHFICVAPTTEYAADMWSITYINSTCFLFSLLFRLAFVTTLALLTRQQTMPQYKM